MTSEPELVIDPVEQEQQGLRNRINELKAKKARLKEEAVYVAPTEESKRLETASLKAQCAILEAEVTRLESG